MTCFFALQTEKLLRMDRSFWGRLLGWTEGCLKITTAISTGKNLPLIGKTKHFPLTDKDLMQNHLQQPNPSDSVQNMHV